MIPEHFTAKVDFGQVTALDHEWIDLGHDWSRVYLAGSYDLTMAVSNCLVTSESLLDQEYQQIQGYGTPSLSVEFKCSSTLLIYVEADSLLLIGGSLQPAAETFSPLQVSGEKPMRIVSLDFCADNYVLKLADPDQILKLFLPDAEKDFSHMRDAAVGFRTVRPVSEDILILKPDLVVRSWRRWPQRGCVFRAGGHSGWCYRSDGLQT